MELKGVITQMKARGEDTFNSWNVNWCETEISMLLTLKWPRQGQNRHTSRFRGQVRPQLSTSFLWPTENRTHTNDTYSSAGKPLPFSSRLRFSFRTLRIEAVSSISDMKVETPLSWLSPAPTLARMLSVMQTSAALQGTKQPSCAISTTTPTCGVNTPLWGHNWSMYLTSRPLVSFRRHG